MCKVSVLMPSLNVADYIEEALQSVVNQTLKDIEIICVDAGSTDGTLEIIESFAADDDRIRILHSDVKSYGYQMNMAVDHARGEYIGIVETDDYVLENMYEELYETAVLNDSDIVWADYYRFIGKGENLLKRRYPVAHRSRYGMKLKPSEYLLGFTFMTTTWCGIYKRAFLKNRNIRYHETPGASFQDISFRFISFMFADSLYYVDRAYYMNRRDNPGSSVFSPEKAFCCCDEFDYIYGIMSSDTELFDTYKFIYTKKLFMVYSSNLQRIQPEDRAGFLKRFSADMKKLRDNGMIDRNTFSAGDNRLIVKIMDDPDGYYNDFVYPYICVRDSIKDKKNIIIYGMGKTGRRLWIDLIYRYSPADVICFAVSKKGFLPDYYQGTPVKEISELTEYTQDGTVVVATSTMHHKEILSELEKYGFRNVILLSERNILSKDDIIPDDPDYTQNLTRWYVRQTGRPLDLAHPKTFNEKQQWLKLHDRNPMKSVFADKEKVREWLTVHGLSEYLNEVIGIYDKADEIPFAVLPKRYVIKNTCMSGSNMFIDREYRESDTFFDARRRELNSLRNEAAGVFGNGFRFEYETDRNRFLVEKAVGEVFPEKNYKFMCFGGKPYYVIHESNKHRYARRYRDVFDMNWKKLPTAIRYVNAPEIPARPEHFEEMKKLVAEMAKGFAFVMIHMFDTEERPVFDEVEFTFENGIEPIPEEYDLLWGKMIRLEDVGD